MGDSFRGFSSDQWYGALAMKRPTPTLLVTVAALTLLAFAQAQDAAQTLRFAFVDTQSLIRAHPASSEIEALGQALESELGELVAQRQELLAKQRSQGLNAEEQELLQALTTTIQSRQQTGVQEIQQAAAPAEQAANEIIRELATSEGYSLVLDIGAASGLVVFANEDVPDVTEQAIALMEERYPAE